MSPQPTDEEEYLQNVQIAAIFGLTDAEWVENWDYLVQTLLHYARRRVGRANMESNGGFSTSDMMEVVLKKRALLPKEKDATITSIVSAQLLQQEYLLSRRWEDLIRVAKFLLAEITKLETGNVPEQSSNALMTMAVGANMLGRGQEALAYLEQSWDCLTIQSLPPHRFKAQLYALIERSHHHALLERPPDGSTNAMQYAHERYLKLAEDIPMLLHDHPWEQIIEHIQAGLKKDLDQAKQVTLDEQAGMRHVARKQAATLREISISFKKYINNPDATPEQRIQALEDLTKIPSLSDVERQRLKRMIRRIRALQALGPEYVPIPLELRPEWKRKSANDSKKSESSTTA